MTDSIDYRFWEGDIKKASSLFDCGNDEINAYFVKKTTSISTEFSNRIILIADRTTIFGFISLSLNQMKTTMFKESNYSVVMIDAIGIDKRYQNKGYGTQLLVCAFKLALSINSVIPIGGIYLVALVEAFEFYEKFDLKNLNAPPEMVPGQREFQMVLNTEHIAALGLSSYRDSLHLKD